MESKPFFIYCRPVFVRVLLFLLCVFPFSYYDSPGWAFTFNHEGQIYNVNVARKIDTARAIRGGVEGTFMFFKDILIASSPCELKASRVEYTESYRGDLDVKITEFELRENTKTVKFKISFTINNKLSSKKIRIDNIGFGKKGITRTSSRKIQIAVESFLFSSIKDNLDAFLQLPDFQNIGNKDGCRDFIREEIDALITGS